MIDTKLEMTYQDHRKASRIDWRIAAQFDFHRLFQEGNLRNWRQEDRHSWVLGQPNVVLYLKTGIMLERTNNISIRCLSRTRILKDQLNALKQRNRMRWRDKQQRTQNLNRCLGCLRFLKWTSRMAAKLFSEKSVVHVLEIPCCYISPHRFDAETRETWFAVSINDEYSQCCWLLRVKNIDSCWPFSRLDIWFLNVFYCKKTTISVLINRQQQWNLLKEW